MSFLSGLTQRHRISLVQLDDNALADLSRTLADAIQAASPHAFFDDLAALLGQFISYDHFLVYQYEAGRVANLLYCNMDREVLLSHMTRYEAGLYLLDPFYVAAVNHRQHGVFRISQVAPIDFESSDYYSSHYRNVSISDEVRYMIPIDDDRWVHAFIERDRRHLPFSEDDFDLLKSLEPLVISLVARQQDRFHEDNSQAEQLKAPLNLGIRGAISRLGNSELTKREIDVVELVLKGHASKSIADRLCISEGTVNNHKRNLYAKLGIKSQGQLFNAFLTELFG